MDRDDEIRSYLKVIRKAADLIEQRLNDEDHRLVKSFLDESFLKQIAPKQEVIIQEPVNMIPEINPRAKHVDDILAIDVWPVAVPAHLEASATKEDQINRANAVLDMMVSRDLKNLDFLDIGCGDGWMVKEALKKGVNSSTGYDILASPVWKEHEGVHLTNVYKNIADKKYDVIMLYDVLDHCEDPVALMGMVKELLKKNGVVYIRCHPWTSKHASHLYKQGLNKAYIHLYLSWEELVDKGYIPLFTRKEVEPIKAYHYWFLPFNIVKETLRTSDIDEFFFFGDFKELVMTEQNIPKEKDAEFIESMKLDFIDYVLSPK